MKPIGKYILVKPIDEELKSSSGLILTSEDANDFRYKKGLVHSVGELVSTIGAEDTIYFDKRTAFSMMINEELYTIIKEQDVVVVV